MIEIFKVKNGLAPKLMEDIFTFFKKPYNLRYNENFHNRNIHSIRYGYETATYIGSKLWKSLPEEFKNAPNLNNFKQKINNWLPEDCPCRLCRIYVKDLGYI